VRRLLAFPLLVALAACGGAAEAPEPVSTTEIAMAESYVFEPATIEVEAGATVRWRNEDRFTHTVQVEGQEDREVEPGENVSITFDEPGRYAYVCTLHRRDMDGEVVVR
jgi:plastocyanin